MYDDAVLNDAFGRDPPINRYPTDRFSGLRPEYGSFGSRYGQSRPDYSPPRPDYGLSRPDYALSRPDYEQARPDYGISRPDYEQSRPNYSSKRPSLDEQRPDFSSPAQRPFIDNGPAVIPSSSDSSSRYRKKIRKSIFVCTM